MKDLKARIADREQREAEAKKQAESEGNASADTGEEEEEEEGGAYDGYTVADLKNELDGRKIEYPANAKKAELLELLTADDEG